MVKLGMQQGANMAHNKLEEFLIERIPRSLLRGGCLYYSVTIVLVYLY